MKKSIIYFILLCCPIILVQAQEFEKGTNVLSASIGFGASYNTFNSASQKPGYALTYERGIWELPGPGVVSLGGYLGTKSYDFNSAFVDDKWRYTILGIRGAYHYNGLNIANFDVYGGIMISYSILTFDGDTSGLNSRADGSVFLGGRWYFLENLAASIEAGYGVSFFSAGLSFRF